ncbi:MAG: 16S rRNA (uracil(1498)-N(3))-methyltransferase [Hyphomicrobium sp.]|uniref:16S rRNA (uracil(1498)-N(3))-methyltransferase n=1 Tax=Hyphomicrobium sp. TaxID=82 RepID=UPI001325EE90|nr:16S rRNA (uracil(1498)-N(3))-methyltransferase [Hyphomicrobium sp.]KAB2941799.1 MAG: 16S rRNA (uracil(1498)-N(3))-methyltransferase [Hyphomicrobium sp.]MBZ0211594.1 16S rRNA (uracil(1498)-N(3))-methyltransferase [Hyphomicrobium sp.]
MGSDNLHDVRLFVDAPLEAGAAVACTPEQANYLVNVLRLGAGAEILVFNGRDGEWRARLVETGKRRCALRSLTPTRPQQNGPDLHYVFAPLKHARLDYMVQKATELGVAHLQPVLTRRTVAARVNLERMRANAIEAAEQCGVLRVPTVGEPMKLEMLLARWEPQRRLIFCDEAAEVASPLAALATIKAGPVAVLIGPEGGFDPAERTSLREKPYASAISLGPRVMRADTAAVAALALVNAALGDWR